MPEPGSELSGRYRLSYKVLFPNQNVTAQVREGDTVLAAEIAAGLMPDAPCGGMGVCGKCLAEILTETGERKSVLACQTKVTRDMTVYTASDGGHRILTEGAGGLPELRPAVRALSLNVERASLSDPTSHWTRLKAAVRSAGGGDIRPDPVMADALGKKLDALGYAPQAVVCGEELLDIRKGGRLLAAAVDIGTTTVVLYLADGQTGTVLSTVSALNPQTEFGADVISRANHAMHNGPDDLSRAIRTAVNGLLADALERAGAEKKDVYSVFIAGNTCMHHLFLGIDPSSLVLSPYVPSVADPLVLDAAAYGLDANPRAKLFMLPCIAGFVGADTSAMMLACGFDRREELTLAIDIGTNGELVIGDKDRAVACSTAAGPAFEGARITFGMRGAAGAIDHASIDNGALTFSVIGGGKPRGICGSGLLDLTASLLRAGVIDETGRLADEDELPRQSRPLAGRLRTVDGMRCFVIADGEQSGTGQCVYLSQKDVREVQLAKGAMAAGISLMLEHLGRRAEDIKKVLIAGAFGSYMSPESACAVGLIPGVLLDRIQAVGNAAGTGALWCALNYECFERAAAMAGRTEFIELASSPDFQDRFVDELMFPEEL